MLRDGVVVDPVCVAALDLIWLDQVLGWLGSCSKFWIWGLFVLVGADG